MGAAAKNMDPLPLFFQAISKDLDKSRAAPTRTSAHKGCLHSKQWPYPARHDASPMSQHLILVLHPCWNPASLLLQQAHNSSDCSIHFSCAVFLLWNCGSPGALSAEPAHLPSTPGMCLQDGPVTERSGRSDGVSLLGLAHTHLWLPSGTAQTFLPVLDRVLTRQPCGAQLVQSLPGEAPGPPANSNMHEPEGILQPAPSPGTLQETLNQSSS